MITDFLFNCVTTRTVPRDKVITVYLVGGAGVDRRSRLGLLAISNSTVSKNAHFNLTLHIHIQADPMVSLNLFSNSNHPQSDTGSGMPTTQEERSTDTANVFEHAHRHLAGYRNLCQVYHVRAYERQNPEIDAWANDLLKTLWTATTTRDPGWYKHPRVRCGFRLNRSG